VTRGSAMTARV